MALGLQPTLGQTDSKKNINRYGLHEGLELVGRVDGKGYETFAVVDENDRLLFAIPLTACSTCAIATDSCASARTAQAVRDLSTATAT